LLYFKKEGLRLDVGKVVRQGGWYRGSLRIGGWNAIDDFWKFNGACLSKGVLADNSAEPFREVPTSQVLVQCGCTVASGNRAFDLLSKGEIRKGLFEVFSFFLFGSGFIRAFQPSKWKAVD
jgi:hypothetical protein